MALEHQRVPVFPLVLVLGLAVGARLLIDFGTPLMPKVNGAYYLVQVRSFLTTGQLAFREFPLLFWLEALIARLIAALAGVGQSASILLACKITDAVVPALVAIPIYLLAWSWRPSAGGFLVPAVAALFSVLYGSALVMTSDFQKNAVGMVWLAAMVFTLYQAAEHPTWRRFALAGLFFVLAGLTHAGVFGVTLAYALFFAAALFLIDPRTRRRFLPVLLLGVGVLLALVGGLALLGVRGKAVNVLSVLWSPVRLFYPSVVSSLALGRPLRLAPPTIIDMILVDGIALGGLWALLSRYVSSRSGMAWARGPQRRIPRWGPLPAHASAAGCRCHKSPRAECPCHFPRTL